MTAKPNLRLVTPAPEPRKQVRGLPFQPTRKQAGDLEMTSKKFVRHVT